MVALAARRGRILRFDEVRGYGFIKPDDGGEDVFLHANAFVGDKGLLAAGMLVEFEVTEGERGLKALAVHAVDGPPAHASPVAESRPAASSSGGPYDDGMCDVLAPADYLQELTEALLEAEPTLTAAQIVRVRRRLLTIAQHHGWTEG
ncbi:cold shock domain-containing protein [Sphaerisporangium flaviroseum]|uniref:Cold shock domain-containing protein n=1 Tax=Sphaerisporangium flaviroseum TaxID=509199 RepID=A0ABP7IKM1_9ACTN